MSLVKAFGIFVILFFITPSCRQARGPLTGGNIGDSDSIVASFGDSLDKLPEEVKKGLQFELLCEGYDVLIGETEVENSQLGVSFKPKKDKPVKVGTECRMEAWGDNLKEKYDFDAPAREKDKKVRYYITETNRLSESNVLRFRIVPTYNKNGIPVMSLLITVTNNGLVTKDTDVASVTCSDEEIKAAGHKNNTFEFILKTSNFGDKNQITCTNMVLITEGGDSWVYLPEDTSTPFAKVTKEINKKLKVDLILTKEETNEPITTEIDELFSGKYVTKCNKDFQKIQIDIKFDEDQRDGILDYTTINFTEKTCHKDNVDETKVAVDLRYRIKVITSYLSSPEKIPNTMALTLIREPEEGVVQKMHTIVNSDKQSLRFGVDLDEDPNDHVWTGTQKEGYLPNKLDPDLTFFKDTPSN